MEKYTDVVQSARSGAAIPSALVTVKTSPAGATATIYSDDGVTTKSNPITTDSNGEFSFYAADGDYTLTVSGTGITERTIGPITLLDPGDADETTLLATDVSFTPSGTGAVARTVASALQSFTQSGSYSTTANFNTATDALTETIGMHSIQAVAAGLQFKFPTNVEATKDGVLTFVPYEFGMAIKLAGSGQNHDNRLELYLGSADTTPAELSVRHNGNSTGARIQARDSGDTDGISLSFEESTPWVRWGNAGPYLVKESAGILSLRNPATVGEDQQLRIANTYTVGGALEYIRLGWDTDRAKVEAIGSGGGTQRNLDINAAGIFFQIAGTSQWRIIAGGHLQSLNGAWIIQDESDANPTTSDLDADDSVAIYNKADTLVFAYNNGGTMTYVKLALDGSSTTWVHDTSAP
jgi:hypothetical protein